MKAYYWFIVDSADFPDSGSRSGRHQRAVFSKIDREIIHSRERAFARLFAASIKPASEDHQRLRKFFDSLAGARKWICAEMFYNIEANSPKYRKLVGDTVVERETPGDWNSTVVQWTREPGTAPYLWYPFLGHESTWLAILPFSASHEVGIENEGQPDFLAEVQALESEAPVYFNSFELTAQAVGTESAEFLCLTGTAEVLSRCIDIGAEVYGEQQIIHCDWASVMQVSFRNWPF